MRAGGLIGFVLACAACAGEGQAGRAPSNDGGAVEASIATGGAGGATASSGGRPNVGGASGFCSGSPIAGTCLAAFFARARACFQDTGSCQTEDGMMGTEVCWSGGARLILVNGSEASGFTYRNGSEMCFYGSRTGAAGARTYTFTANGVDLVVYEQDTGETICEDGTSVTLAPGFGGCSELTALVELDATGCAPGVCD